MDTGVPFFLDLPLSWRRTSLPEPSFTTVRLSFSNFIWIALAEIPFGYSFEKVYQDHLSKLESPFVLRGCKPAIANFLKSENCIVLENGIEAILDLNETHLNKKSLQELVRRGLRHGEVQEISLTKLNLQKLSELKKATPNSHKPQLNYLFRQNVDALTRVFVFSSHTGLWLGALTLSQNNLYSFHTELILRRVETPVGVMEALVAHIFRVLKSEGNDYWSLGEVPFRSPWQRLSYKSRLFQRAGRLLKFAYNHSGLFAFKNKFSPNWQPVYLCARPSLSLMALVGMFIKSNYLKLVLYSLHPIKRGRKLHKISIS